MRLQTWLGRRLDKGGQALKTTEWPVASWEEKVKVYHESIRFVMGKKIGKMKLTKRYHILGFIVRWNRAPRLSRASFITCLEMVKRAREIFRGKVRQTTKVKVSQVLEGMFRKFPENDPRRWELGP